MLKLLHLTTQASESLLRLLESNVIGTPKESVLYQQLDTRKKLNHLDKGHFLNLQKGKNIIGTCCFVERDCKHRGELIKTFYVRYFTFLSAFRTSKKKEANTNKKNSTLRSDVEYILKGNQISPSSTAALFYAYVDPLNSRSAVLCREYGFEKYGSFQSFMFGRLFPERKLNIEAIEEQDKLSLREKLKTQYGTFNFYNDNNLFFENKYFVLKDEQNEIVIGAQANPTHWNVRALKGKWGETLLNIVDRLPILNRLISKNYRFAAIDYVFIKKGHEYLLTDFLESVLELLCVNSALILCDEKSFLFNIIRDLDLGLIHKLNKPTNIDIILRSINLKKEQIEQIKSHASYISSFDTT